MVVSPFFTDEELISQLKLNFEYDEQNSIDFYSILGQIVERSEDYYIEIKGRKFSIDKITGITSEITEGLDE